MVIRDCWASYEICLHGSIEAEGWDDFMKNFAVDSHARSLGRTSEEKWSNLIPRLLIRENKHKLLNLDSSGDTNMARRDEINKGNGVISKTKIDLLDGMWKLGCEGIIKKVKLD